MNRRFALALLVILFTASCGRKQGAASSPQRPDTARTAAQTLAEPPATLSTPPAARWVSCGGMFTNLVYAGDHDRLLGKDQRTPEEIETAIAADTNNADLWFALGKCYWDRYQDLPRTAQAFEKSAMLAPDALAPRMYLAETFAAQLRVPEAQQA